MSTELLAGNLYEIGLERHADGTQRGRLRIHTGKVLMAMSDGFTCWSGQEANKNPIGYISTRDNPIFQKTPGYHPRHTIPPRDWLSYNQARFVTTEEGEWTVYVLPGRGSEIHFSIGDNNVDLEFVDDLTRNLGVAMVYIGRGEEATEDVKNLIRQQQEKQGIVPVKGEIGAFSWASLGRKNTLQSVFRELAVAAMLGLDVYTLDDGYIENGDYIQAAELVLRFVAECQKYSLTPGVWYAPYIVSPKSRSFAIHPEWLQRDEKGNPISLGTLSPYPMLALDVSLPEVQEHAFEIMKTMRLLGVIEHKIDFLPAAVMGRLANNELTAMEYARAPIIRFIQWCRENDLEVVLQVCGTLGDDDITHKKRYGMDPLPPPNGGLLAPLKEVSRYVGTNEILTILNLLGRLPKSEELIRRLTREHGLKDIVEAIVSSGEIHRFYNRIYELGMYPLEWRNIHQGSLFEPNGFRVWGMDADTIYNGRRWVAEKMQTGDLGNISFGDLLSGLSPRQLDVMSRFVNELRQLR